MVGDLVLCRRYVTDGLEQPSNVEPIDPLERRELHVLQRAPRTSAPDHFRLEQTDDRLGQSVVVRIATTADRGCDSGLGQSLGVADRQVLRAAIAVMQSPSRSPARS